MDLQRRRPRMDVRMQPCIQRHEAPTLHGGREMRVQRGHAELHVTPGLVQEVAEDGAGDDVCGAGPPETHGG